MIDLIRGALRGKAITQGSGAGGTTFCNIRPPAGEVWDVYAIRATHDDVARTIHWWVSDTDAGTWYSLYDEAGVTAAHYFARDVGLAVPVRINYNCYLMYGVDSMAGAKTITCNVMIERIVGAPKWTGV